jgi:hypothetical protein
MGASFLNAQFNPEAFIELLHTGFPHKEKGDAQCKSPLATTQHEK